jgi:hypothetical protein
MKAIYRFTELWTGGRIFNFADFTLQNYALLVRSTVEAVFVLAKLLLAYVHFSSVFEPNRYAHLHEVADFVSFSPRW